MERDTVTPTEAERAAVAKFTAGVFDFKGRPAVGSRALAKALGVAHGDLLTAYIDHPALFPQGHACWVILTLDSGKSAGTMGFFLEGVLAAAELFRGQRGRWVGREYPKCAS